MARKMVAFELDEDLRRAIDMEQVEGGNSKSTIVRRALRSYLKHHLDQIVGVSEDLRQEAATSKPKRTK